jgi:DNA modification methylase
MTQERSKKSGGKGADPSPPSPMAVEAVPIDSLSPDPANARKHGARNLETVIASFRRFGQQIPLVVDKSNVVRVGNARLEAAKQLGWDTIQIVRTDLTSSEAIAYAIADNRTAELAEWDDDVLAAQLNGLLAEDEELLASAGFTDEELEELLGGIDGVDPAEITEDEVPEPPADPITKPGDLWILGRHRVLCGDSTKTEDVARLMDGAKADMIHTDPPYGMSFQSNMRTKSKKFDELENDDKILTGWIAPAIGASSGWVFVWTTWKVLEQWLPVVREFGRMTNLVVWAKGGGGIGDLKGTFATDHEMAMVFNRGAEICGKRIGSVWSFGKDAAASYMHPTQKPVALAAEAIDKTTHKQNLVYDPFLGSGTTLIAAEQLGRKCYGMEISPQYCDVIVNRWETLTGQKATLQAADRPASTGAVVDQWLI